MTPSAYPKSIERIVRLQIEKVAGRFSPLLTSKEIAKIIFITEEDKSWVSQKLPKIVPPNEYGGALEILNSYGTKEKFYSRAGTGGQLPLTFLKKVIPSTSAIHQVWQLWRLTGHKFRPMNLLMCFRVSCLVVFAASSQMAIRKRNGKGISLKAQ